MNEKLKYAANIGEQMLLSGGEVHRVEDSVSRMCRALGATRVDCFIITSSIVLTVTDENGENHTVTRRINGAGTDFTKLSRLNDLSRRICSGRVKFEEIGEEYEKIISALEKGDFYASEAPEIKELWYEDGRVNIVTSEAVQISFNTGNRRSRV